MQGTFIIRLKALLLSAIFTGNFIVVCHCSAGAARMEGLSSMHGHCCCQQKKSSSKGAQSCPGTQAVKFNLLEKKAAGTVQLSPVGAIFLVTDFVAVPGEGLARCDVASLYLAPHAPPDRLALYQCYLI